MTKDENKRRKYNLNEEINKMLDLTQNMKKKNNEHHTLYEHFVPLRLSTPARRSSGDKPVFCSPFSLKNSKGIIKCKFKKTLKPYINKQHIFFCNCIKEMLMKMMTGMLIEQTINIKHNQYINLTTTSQIIIPPKNMDFKKFLS